MRKRPIIKLVFCIITVFCFISDIAFAKSNKLSDDIIFTCDEFPEKIQNCQSYTCYVTMGGVMTVTEILEERGPLCAVSSTIGVTLPTPKPKPGEEPAPRHTIPVTKVCEYDRDGINQLSNKFQAMKGGRYDFSSEEMEVGEHNCQTFALGQSFPTPRTLPSKRDLWQ